MTRSLGNLDGASDGIGGTDNVSIEAGTGNFSKRKPSSSLANSVDAPYVAGRSGVQGPKGDKGDKGDPGDPGPAGEKGEKGDDATAATEAQNVAYANPTYATVQEALDALLYVPVDVTAFSNNIGTVEIGSTVQSLTLNWAVNKAVTSLSISNGVGTVLGTSFKNLTGPWTADTSWTISASDGKSNDSATTTLAFRNRRYWGVSSKTTLSDADILALTGEFSTSRGKTVSYNATGGNYPYYCYPASFGAPANVTVGGLAFSAYTVTTRDFVNASGLAVSYNIIRFNGIQTGANISVVWS